MDDSTLLSTLIIFSNFPSVNARSNNTLPIQSLFHCLNFRNSCRRSNASYSSWNVILWAKAGKLNVSPNTASCDRMHSRLKLLKDEIKKSYFLQLKRFLWEEGVHGAEDSPTPAKVYPLRTSVPCHTYNLHCNTKRHHSAKNIYAWSNTPLGRVRAVIIGQDPYHGPGQAHGETAT